MKAPFIYIYINVWISSRNCDIPAIFDVKCSDLFFPQYRLNNSYRQKDFKVPCNCIMDRGKFLPYDGHNSSTAFQQPLLCYKIRMHDKFKWGLICFAKPLSIAIVL